MDEVFVKVAEMDDPMLLLSLQSFAGCFLHEMTVSIRFVANLFVLFVLFFFLEIRVEEWKRKRIKTSMLVFWHFS